MQTADAAGSYYVCTQGSEGVGSAGVQVSLVVSLQKADVIVTLRLREEEWHKKWNSIGKTAKQSVCVAVKENPAVTQLSEVSLRVYLIVPAFVQTQLLLLR